MSSSPDCGPGNDQADDVGLAKSTKHAVPSLSVSATPAKHGDLLTKYVKAGSDTSIQPLLGEILDHLDSIEANTLQASGIGPRIATTKALVEDALYTYSQTGLLRSGQPAIHS